MKLISIYLFLLILNFLETKIIAQVTDINGQTYKTVVIGSQMWMAENLNVDKFRNGDIIPEVKTAKDWEKAGKNQQPAWCYYSNNSINGQLYGKLYNWYAVNDERGLSPEGWHIPLDEEWQELNNFLAPNQFIVMKSKFGWISNFPNNEENSCGFNGLPGGDRTYFGHFDYAGYFGTWWTATQFKTKYVWCRDISNENSDINRSQFSKGDGVSLRCIKD